jgi:tetratricopeptide (TPR) repeat protein
MVGAATGSGGARPVFGREEVVVEILRALDGAAEGRGQGLLLVGPNGIGKSTLLEVARERATARGFRILHTRALPRDLPAPLSLLRELLRVGGAPDDDEEPTAHPGESPSGSMPIYLLPFLADRSDEVVVTPGITPIGGARGSDLADVLSSMGPAGDEPSGQGRLELIGRVAGYLRDMARAQPLLLAIDDLQFADGPSLEVLRRLAGEMRGASLVVIGTALEGPAAPDRTRPAIEDLRRAPTFRTARVRPFGPAEVTEFVRWVQGGRAPPPGDVLRWHAQTEGNPLFVEQVVRATMGFGGAGMVPPIGRDVAELLRARVASLGDVDRRILSYGAVLGKEFAFADLSAVAGTTEERTTEGLDRLVHEGLLRERGGEVYEFVSESVRVGVYAELTETRRRILHQKVGRALEQRGGTSDSELARQFYLGRDDPKAVEFNLKAAQAASRAYAFDTAASHVQRALEAERRRTDRSQKTELRLLTELGRLLLELGNLRRSDEVLTEAVSLARMGTGLELELGRALLGLARTRGERSDFASCIALGTEASEILAKVGTPRDLVAAHRALGVAAWRLGRAETAQEEYSAALAIAEKDGTPSEVGHLLVDLANTMVPGGSSKIGQALALYGRAADLFAEGDDLAARSRVLMNRAAMQYSAGRTDEALADLELAIEAAEKSRSPIWIGYCYLNLAQIEAERGHTGPARHAVDRAVEAIGWTGDRLAVQQLAMARGMVDEAESSYSDAEAHYADALAQANELALTGEVAEVRVHQAHLALARGETQLARERVSAARASEGFANRPDLLSRLEDVERRLPPEPDPHA